MRTNTVRLAHSLAYLEYMKNWFKPLFFYKKYLLADKILKNCCGSFAVLSNDPHENPMLTEKQYPNVYIAPYFLTINKPIDSSRLIEAVDLLERDGHIIANRNLNLHHFSIKCTKKGESAFNEGFYKKKVIAFGWKIIGATGLGSTVVWLLTQYILK